MDSAHTQLLPAHMQSCIYTFIPWLIGGVSFSKFRYVMCEELPEKLHDGSL